MIRYLTNQNKQLNEVINELIIGVLNVW
jgi:hypothetical protein